MKKSKKLKELELKLKNQNEQLDIYEKNKFDENGSINFDCVMKIQKLQTEIYYTEKKIGFLHQGKNFLGECFGSTNVNKYLK